MTSNQRITLTFTGGSGTISYSISKSGTTIFTGSIYRTSTESVTVDVTDILTPFVAAPDITTTTAAVSSLTATFGVTATGATPSANSITVNYLNDLGTTDESGVAPTTYTSPVFGQPIYTYSTRTRYTVNISTSTDCSKRYALIWSNRWGMPESMPVAAVLSASTAWEGLQGERNDAGSQHRTMPLTSSPQLSWSITTPIIAKSLRNQFVKSLGLAQKVYLYDIDNATMYPVDTPSVAGITGKAGAFELTVKTSY